MLKLLLLSLAIAFAPTCGAKSISSIKKDFASKVEGVKTYADRNKVRKDIRDAVAILQTITSRWGSDDVCKTFGLTHWGKAVSRQEINILIRDLQRLETKLDSDRLTFTPQEGKGIKFTISFGNKKKAKTSRRRKAAKKVGLVGKFFDGIDNMFDGMDTAFTVLFGDES